MDEFEKKVLKIPTMEAFDEFANTLNLTDRQRKIFYLRYSRGMCLVPLAEEMEIDKKTVQKELREIKEKLRAVFEKGLTSD